MSMIYRPVSAQSRETMRMIGNGRSHAVGLFGPTDDEIQSSVENSKLAPCVVPKGVYRYRTHAEANVAADQVKRALELRDPRWKTSRSRAVVRRIFGRK